MTSALGTVDDFFAGGAKSFKFENQNDTVIGVITDQFVSQQSDFKTKELLYNKDNSPRNQLVVTLQTQLRDPQLQNDDGKRSVYVKSGLRQAVGVAVRATGRSKLENGGVLKIVLTGFENTGQGSPKKLYVATYAPPASPEEQALAPQGQPQAQPQFSQPQGQPSYQPQQQPQYQQPQPQAQPQYQQPVQQQATQPQQQPVQQAQPQPQAQQAPVQASPTGLDEATAALLAKMSA